MIELIKYRQQGLALLYLDRREKQNAYNIALLESFKLALEEVRRDPEILALVIGSRAKAFCAGGDLELMVQGKDLFQGPASNLERLYKKHIQDLTLQLYHFPKLTVAMVEGAAVGAGAGLALACRWIFAGPQASFSLPFHQLELVPGDGSLWLLKQRIGEGKALWHLMTGQNISLRVTPELFNRLVDQSFAGGMKDLLAWWEQLPGNMLTKMSSLLLAQKTQASTLEEHLTLARKFQAQLQTHPAHQQRVREVVSVKSKKSRQK